MAPVTLFNQCFHLSHQEHIGIGVESFMQKDGCPEIPKQTGPMTTIVVAPWPILGIGPCFVLPLDPIHGWMADAHRHLSHQIVAVVINKAKQSPLLWRGEQAE